MTVQELIQWLERFVDPGAEVGIASSDAGEPVVLEPVRHIYNGEWALIFDGNGVKR